jgi:hypothetical protein
MNGVEAAMRPSYLCLSTHLSRIAIKMRPTLVAFLKVPKEFVKPSGERSERYITS